MKQTILMAIGLPLIVIISACTQTIPTNEARLSETIETRAGELNLKYENGAATLSGTLQRSTPCVNWTVQIAATKDLPVSQVNIKIFDSNRESICIQVLGSPQEISNKIIQISENTNYAVALEDETVFEGKLSRGASK